MRLNGDRILIRELHLNDFDDYYEYTSDENVGPSAGWKPVTSPEICKRVLSGNMLSKEMFAIEFKSEKKLIGTISIYNNCVRKYKYCKQLGFSLNSKYWNNGYMTEAVKLIIQYLFENTDTVVIEAGHHSDNYGSKRVIEKCGFNYDGRLCKYKLLYDGRLIDADFYSITKEDYERRKRYE